MFPARYFAPRYFAPRYWPKVGAAPTPPAPSGVRFLVNNGEVNMTGQGEGTVGYAVKLTQGANLGPTTIFTADRTGLYRVSATALDAVAGGAGTLSVSIAWGAYTKTFITALSLTSLGGSEGYSQFVYLTAADTVDYTATITGGVGSPKYDLFVTVERIWTSS